MKLAIFTDLRQRYSEPDISALLDKCTFLNPRFHTSSEGTKVRITDGAMILLMNTDSSTSSNSTSSAADCSLMNLLTQYANLQAKSKKYFIKKFWY